MLSLVVERYGIKETVLALRRVKEQYGDQLGETTARLLVDLYDNPRYSQVIQELLEGSEAGRELLHKVDWPHLWPAVPRAVPSAVANWLSIMGLTFNPFGSDSAELDRRLPWYVVDTVYKDVRGACPAVLFGAPGAGKTAAAMMLAYDCTHPPANPRGAGAFPVYYRLRLIGALPEERSASLAPLARATARQLLRYLALRPDGFLDLPTYRQDALHIFITLAYAGSESLLAAEVSRLPTSLKTLLVPMPSLETGTQSLRVLDQDWVELLAEALPAGFCRYEWLIDVPDLKTQTVGETPEVRRSAYRTELLQIIDEHLDKEELRTLCFDLEVDWDGLPAEGKKNKARELIKNLERRDRILDLLKYIEQRRSDIYRNHNLEAIRKTLSEDTSAGQLLLEKRAERLFEALDSGLLALVNLALPLAASDVYLKFFIPHATRSTLGDCPGLRMMHLVWWEDDLSQMLDDRIRQAGGDSLMALCGPEIAADFEPRFIQAAQGSPRRLVRLGNALLSSASGHPNQPLLTEEDFENALRSIGTMT